MLDELRVPEKDEVKKINGDTASHKEIQGWIVCHW